MRQATIQAAAAAICAVPVRLDDLYTVDSLVGQYPAFLSIPTLRWQLRHREANALVHCCVKSGKKLLISKSRYEQWLAGQADRGVTA
jgi:hypothetical protein